MKQDTFNKIGKIKGAHNQDNFSGFFSVTLSLWQKTMSAFSFGDRNMDNLTVNGVMSF